MARPVFYSFHFDNDVMRVQLVRNIGALEDNKPASPNVWEEVKRRGSTAIQNWIDENMKHRQSVVVLVGSETANRHWVQYEIRKAWKEGRGLLGIHIHNLRCPRNGTCSKGPNPFDKIIENGTKLSSVIPCYDPPAYDAYGHISSNMERWVEQAIQQSKSRG